MRCCSSVVGAQLLTDRAPPSHGSGIGFSYTTDAGFVGEVYARAIR